MLEALHSVWDYLMMFFLAIVTFMAIEFSRQLYRIEAILQQRESAQGGTAEREPS